MASNWNKNQFKYLGYKLNEKGTDDADNSRKVVKYRKVTSAIESFGNAKGLSLECNRVLHEDSLLPMIMCNIIIMMWNENKWSKMQSVQIDNLGCTSVSRADKLRNEYKCSCLV